MRSAMLLSSANHVGGATVLMIYNLANLYYVFFKALLFQVKFADVFKDRGKNELLFVDCSSTLADMYNHVFMRYSFLTTSTKSQFFT